MPNPNQGANQSIRFVIYDIATKRPISQGTCLRGDFNLVVQGLPHGQGGDNARIMNSNDVLDLEPYDIILDPNAPTPTGINAHRAGFAAATGKTVNDAITDIADLDTE